MPTVSNSVAKKCLPKGYWDAEALDSVWVDANCQIYLKPSYWAEGINTQLSYGFCRAEIDARSDIERRYDLTLLEFNKALLVKDQLIAGKDKIIADKDTIISRKQLQLELKDSVKISLKDQLNDTEKLVAYWRTTAIGIFLIAVAEGFIIYKMAGD